MSCFYTSYIFMSINFMPAISSVCFTSSIISVNASQSRSSHLNHDTGQLEMHLTRIVVAHCQNH